MDAPLSRTLCLVGSGEYLPQMAETERRLFQDRPKRYIQIPTAATGEGAERLKYWIDLGIAQAERIGVEPVPLAVSTREQANDPSIVSQIDGAGVIYFSGGSPKRLVEILQGTALLERIRQAYEDGCPVAGCSAGAMGLGAWVPSLRGIIGSEVHGFGFEPRVAVLPHFDRFGARVPPGLTSTAIRPPQGVTLVGIDENTAIVGNDGRYEVTGHGRAWVIKGSEMRPIESGESLELA
ncbi:MAG: cyanophycinase [Acidimicrobiales bacterium]